MAACAYVSRTLPYVRIALHFMVLYLYCIAFVLFLYRIAFLLTCIWVVLFSLCFAFVLHCIDVLHVGHGIRIGWSSRLVTHRIWVRNSIEAYTVWGPWASPTRTVGHSPQSHPCSVVCVHLVNFGRRR